MHDEDNVSKESSTAPFEAAAASAHPERGPTLGHSPAFVGRRDELETLYNSIRDMVNRKRLHRVAVVGDAGSGKSRLVDEFFDLIQAASRGLTVIRASIEEGDADGPTGLLAAVMRARFGLSTHTTEADGRRRLTEGVAAILGKAEPADVTLLAAVLGLGSARGALRDDEDARSLRQAALALCGTILRADASKKPLVLVIDGFRWVGDSATDPIVSFCEAASDLPVLLLLLSRRTLPAVLNAAPGERRTLALGPLAPREVERLAANVLEPVEGITEPMLRAVVEKSGGMPGLLLDVVGVMTHRRILVFDSETGKWIARPDKLSQASLPGTIGESSKERIAELSEKERGILEKAAVFGSTFWFSAVLYLMRTEPEPEPELWWVEDVKQLRLSKVLLELQARGNIEFRTESVLDGVPEFRFRSSLDREALLAALPAGKLHRYHRLAGRYMRATRPATGLGRWYKVAGEHLEAGGDPVGAAEAYLAGAAAAHESLANVLAAELCQRGIGLLDEDQAPLLLELHAKATDVLMTDHEYAEASKQVRRALQLSVMLSDKARGARLYLVLGQTLRGQGDRDGARKTYDLANKLFLELNDRAGLAEGQRLVRELSAKAGFIRRPLGSGGTIS